jgi:hypothetical protein
MKKFEIGEFVLVLIGENKIKGRISRQTHSELIAKNEYFVHTFLSTFLIESDYIFCYNDNDV